MADEPRRSGRATKGQHHKGREAPDEAAPKKKGRGRGAKAKQVEEEEEEDEPEEIIRCICGQYEEEEDVPRAMICCDNCSAWQHNDCMGLAEDYEADKYFCEQCRPDDHKALLDSIARGEKPWEEAARKREALEAEKPSKKKGKRGRKSATAQPTPSQEPEPAATPKTAAIGQKRKAEETPVPEVRSKKVRATPAAENGTPAAPTTPATPATPQTRKPSMPARQLSRAESTAGPAAQDISELPNAQRKGAAQSLIKLFTDMVAEAVKSGSYKIPDGSSASEQGTQLGLQVEHAMFSDQPSADGVEPGDFYKNQLRAISFNLKKNRELAGAIVSGEVTARELASMDPKDMASKEQQRKDAAIMKEMEKQHEMVKDQDPGPKIKKTHKGDEYVDDTHNTLPESTSDAAASATEKDVKGSGARGKGRQPLSVNTQAKARPSDPRRKSSSNFDIDRVWSGVQGSPDGETPRFPELSQHRTPPPVGNAGNDPDVDKLLKDEDAESEPYSPKDYDDEGVVWRGTVNGNNLGRFSTTAKHAAGTTPEADTLRLTWPQVMPHEIAIHGRINPQKADDYLCGLQYSNSSDLIVVALLEPRDAQNAEGFGRLFKYLKTKERYGVGAQHQNPAIKDIYLLPLDAGQALPAFMKLLQTEFADPVPEKMFLVPIVIKNSELPHNMNAASQAAAIMSPTGGPAVAPTPITPQEVHTPGASHHSYGQNHQHTPNGNAQSVQTHHSPPPPHDAEPHQARPAPNPPGVAGAPPDASPAIAAAYRVLGAQLATAPAVTQLVAQAPTAGDMEMRVIQECIQENAEAANDLTILTTMLHARSQQGQARKTPTAPPHNAAEVQQPAQV